MKSVVISVRGTLSLRDTLTDMSFSPLAIYVGGVKEAYVHGVSGSVLLCKLHVRTYTCIILDVHVL